MSLNPPMAPCLTLLKAFDKDNPTPQQAIAIAADSVQTVLGPKAMADLNLGQFAALTDWTIQHGEVAFVQSHLATWVRDGNLTLPPAHLALDGPRGMARRDVWNIGNSA